MSQIEVTKTTIHVALGPDSDEIAVPKFAVFVVLAPSGASEDPTPRYSQVFSNVVRKPT